MKIWKRITLGFISVIIIMIIVDLNALMNNIEIFKKVDDLEKSKRIELTHSNKIAYIIQRVKSNVRELFLESASGERPEEIINARKEVETYITDLLSSIKILHDATHTGYLFSEEEEEKEGELREIAKVDSLIELTPEFIEGIWLILNLMDKGEWDEAEEVFEYKVEPVSRIIQDSVSVIVKDAEEEVALAINQLKVKVDKATSVTIT